MIIIVLILIHTIRNTIIISNLQNKVEKYSNSNNYHIKATMHISENITMNSQNIVNTPISNIDDSQYVHCPHCGAVIKKDAPRCFMCGKER